MLGKQIVPANPASFGNENLKLNDKESDNVDTNNVIINIPFPKDNTKSNKYKSCANDCSYFLVYVIKYVAIFFALSFIGKIGAKFIYWANETNNWKYPDGWDWGEISGLIFLQAFVGILIVGICIGCCAK